MNTKNESIIDLYTDLAAHPEKDFGWGKGIENARNLGYKIEWLDKIPGSVWQYCAAVGNPFVGEFKPGSTVLDLGCGAGVDLCVASLLAGESAKVIGIDLTPAMVLLARENAESAGRKNITVMEGSIDKINLPDLSVDYVISNGAINLVSSKECLFKDVYRVLVPGGILSFADMVKLEEHSASCTANESWANCVAGTMKPSELIQLMEKAGFIDAKMEFRTGYKTDESTTGAVFSARKSIN